MLFLDVFNVRPPAAPFSRMLRAIIKQSPPLRARFVPEVIMAWRRAHLSPTLRAMQECCSILMALMLSGNSRRGITQPSEQYLSRK